MRASPFRYSRGVLVSTTLGPKVSTKTLTSTTRGGLGPSATPSSKAGVRTQESPKRKGSTVTSKLTELRLLSLGCLIGSTGMVVGLTTSSLLRSRRGSPTNPTKPKSISTAGSTLDSITLTQLYTTFTDRLDRIARDIAVLKSAYGLNRQLNRGYGESYPPTPPMPGEPYYPGKQLLPPWQVTSQPY